MGSVVLIAVALAMDACAAAVSCGASVPGFDRGQALRLGLWFGGFQAAMPLAGWALGSGVSRYLAAFGPYVACAVLAALGVKMVWEALGDPAEGAACPVGPWRLTAMATATSIDALAAGVSMVYMDVGVSIWAAAAVIGGVAFALSLLGGLLGGRLGGLFRRRAALAGGAALIALGVQNLLDGLGG